MFSSKMVILKGIWHFSLSRYCFSQFSFFRHRYRTLISSACLMLELGFKQHDLVRTMFTGLATQFMKPGSVPHDQSDGNKITYMSWVHTAWVYHVTLHAGAFLKQWRRALSSWTESTHAAHISFQATSFRDPCQLHPSASVEGGC